MTVTKEQAQMLTTLAIACRPYRAPTWDEAGVMASISKVKDWSLSEVALRVIVAAADREAKTPAVIASPDMKIPETKPPLFKPQPYSADRFCHVCGQALDHHRLTDHEPVSAAAYAAQLAKTPRDVARIVADLRERTQPDAAVVAGSEE